MSNRKRIAAIAACAAVVIAGRVQGAAEPAPDALSLSPAIYASSTDQRTPLMGWLESWGVVGPLDEARLTVGGHVQLGWTYNFDRPDNHVNPGRVFDFEDQDPTFHQFDIFVDRAVEPSGDKFDIGGRMEWMWGGDARFIHANGLFDHYGFPLFPGSPATNDGPDEQFDLVQLYMTMNLPVGNGIVVKAGKFVTPLGYETINPVTNPLYSHTFLFGFAIPFTHTGVTATYQIDKNWAVMGGIVRGWDQALEDNNDMVSFLGQVAYTSDKLDVIVTAITGPEQEDDEDDYRTVFDAIVVYREGDNLQFVLNADYGWESGLGIPDDDDPIWWGAAGYILYEIDPRLTAVARVEYFSDQDGGRGVGTELLEVTLGMNIKPMPDHRCMSGLIIRPEIRWDRSPDEVFDSGTDQCQFTFGIDAIFAF